MAEVSYMEELDNVANLKAIVVKLSYKLRERWRNVVCGVQEQSGRRVRFKELVEFINKQAKIALHPVFGDIKDSTTAKTSTIRQNNYKEHNKGVIKKSFTTSAVKMGKQEFITESKEHAYSAKNSATKRCAFCDNEHNIDSCIKLKDKPHDEKIEFLKRKGICFGCLKQGHMSKNCKGKVSCHICSLTHPTLLHINKKSSAAETEKKTKSSETQTVFSAFIATETEGRELTGAVEDDCTLAIVPVQVKSKRGSVVVQTYRKLSNILYRGVDA